jgi:parallel beta-helix repeat protein
VITISHTKAALGLSAALVLILVAIAVPVLLLRRPPVQGHPASQVGPFAIASPSPSASPSARPTPESPLAGSTANCPTGQLVHDAAELKQALADINPGGSIDLAAGTYSGQFVANMSGTAAAPITLCGGRDAVIDGGAIKLGYALHLDKVDWWRVIGFTIQGGQKGVVTDLANHVLISNLYVHDVGDEGIHLRNFSSDNTVEGNTVRNTGLLVAKFGEGIYVGTAHSNWCKFSSCKVDNSDRNVVRGNDISNTTAENIDIKEGTTGGVIEGNHLAGDGMVASAATAWINVKGNQWTISGNVGVHSIKDGFQVHSVYSGWGFNNVFRANQAQVDGPGYGYYVQSKSLATVVGCNNTATGAGQGLTNAQCTNAS